MELDPSSFSLPKLLEGLAVILETDLDKSSSFSSILVGISKKSLAVRKIHSLTSSVIAVASDTVGKEV
jgi:hypothetical protein